MYVYIFLIILFIFRISTCEGEDNFLGQSPFIHRFPKTDLSDTDSVSIQVTSLPRMDMSNVMFLLKQQANLSFTFDGGGGVKFVASGRSEGGKKNKTNVCRDPRLNRLLSRNNNDEDLNNDKCSEPQDHDYLLRRNREENSHYNNHESSEFNNDESTSYNDNGDFSGGVYCRVTENVDHQLQQQHQQQQNSSSANKYKSIYMNAIESSCSNINNTSSKRKDDNLDDYFYDLNNKSHLNDDNNQQNLTQTCLNRQTNDLTGCNSNTSSTCEYVGEKYKKVGRHHDVGFSRDLLQHESSSNQNASMSPNIGFFRETKQHALSSQNTSTSANANAGFAFHRKETLVANHIYNSNNHCNRDATRHDLPSCVSDKDNIESISDISYKKNGEENHHMSNVSDHQNTSYNQRSFYEYSSRQQQQTEHLLQEEIENELEVYDGHRNKYDDSKSHSRDNCSSRSGAGDVMEKESMSSMSLSQLLESCDNKNKARDINSFQSTSAKIEQQSSSSSNHHDNSTIIRNPLNSPSNHNQSSSPYCKKKGFNKNANSHDSRNSFGDSSKDDNLSTMMQGFVLGHACSKEVGNEVYDDEEDDDDDLESYNYDEEMTPERFVVVNEKLVRLKGPTPPPLEKSAKSSGLPGTSVSSGLTSSGVLGGSSSAAFLQRRARSKSVSPNFVQRQQVSFMKFLYAIRIRYEPYLEHLVITSGWGEGGSFVLFVTERDEN